MYISKFLVSIFLVASVAGIVQAKGVNPVLASIKDEEKIFVVERENNSLGVIEQGMTKGHIEGMHDMNHGVVKFYDNDGYVISRDGYIIKFDPQSEKILKAYKTSDSAIGFTVEENYIAVANYAKKSVDILDRDLNPIKSFETDSKNVGIKKYKNYLVFSQMNNDKITVLKDKNEGKGLPDFEIFKEFENVGVMPFDAMIKNNNFITGFFKSNFFGVVNLDTMEYSKIDILLEDRKPVLKVPHFGFWSISEGNVFIPAVGNNKVLVYTSDFKFVKNIEVEGLPVFTALSPDQKYMAVTFSGDKFPVLQIIDTKTLEVIKRFEFDGKVLHVRWSDVRPNLYVSVNDTNKVAVINTKEWYLAREMFGINKPSGIFLYKEAK
ncbi:Nitrite reductase NirF [Sulfurimonas denitrificans DSM 1251]|jgi:protein NirF|uniref:Nitrite reductase NirF n=1 Tax=Sulfurimonas denitrificans (strain ATCC 33889 / DSM 1251) TaxID=326298 RepID=Q30P19_SULDN|nr:cytochrome D1 domain-containing protein [Sulfurimonas denitrificans]ABB45262.1 Nitrite reductase NirF [Sulfurimonas denitrificans DSM 1251]MDD3442061.1 cytochrome D1 domain-containing protein [Sulfurimonas denitrificans]